MNDKLTAIGMAALVLVLLAGVYVAGQAYAQATSAEYSTNEPVDSAIKLVVSVSIVVSTLAGLVSWAISTAKAKGLIKAGDNAIFEKIAHGADYLKGTDQEVLDAKKDITRVARALTAFDPRIGDILKEHQVDVETLAGKADALAGELEELQGSANQLVNRNG